MSDDNILLKKREIHAMQNLKGVDWINVENLLRVVICSRGYKNSLIYKDLDHMARWAEGVENFSFSQDSLTFSFYMAKICRSFPGKTDEIQVQFFNSLLDLLDGKNWKKSTRLWAAEIIREIILRGYTISKREKDLILASLDSISGPDSCLLKEYFESDFS